MRLFFFIIVMGCAIWLGWSLSEKDDSKKMDAQLDQESQVNSATDSADLSREGTSGAHDSLLKTERAQHIVVELEKSYKNYLAVRDAVLAEHKEIERLRQLLGNLQNEPIYDRLGLTGKAAFFEFKQANKDFVSEHYRNVALKTKADAFVTVTEEKDWTFILQDTLENAGLRESLNNMMLASDKAAGFDATRLLIKVENFTDLQRFLRSRVTAYRASLDQDIVRFNLPPVVALAMRLEWERSLKTTILQTYINSYLRSNELNAAAKETQHWLSQLGNNPKLHLSKEVTDRIEIIQMNIDLSL